MKQMPLIEMDGFLKGKCIPRDLKVNETNAEYLVRKLGELESKLNEQREYYEGVISDGSKRIAELEKQCAEWERKALSNFEECAAMAERIEEMQTKSAPDSFGIIGENIRTQDNRITSDPMFCVYQKREIVVDAEKQPFLLPGSLTGKVTGE